MIEAALDLTTTGEYVRRGLRRALRLLAGSPQEAAYELGNGSRISAQDTVPYVLWAASTRLADYEAAVRVCVVVGGDMDTTSAMVGGIVAAHLAALRFRPRGWPLGNPSPVGWSSRGPRGGNQVGFAGRVSVSLGPSAWGVARTVRFNPAWCNWQHKGFWCP